MLGAGQIPEERRTLGQVAWMVATVVAYGLVLGFLGAMLGTLIWGSPV
jgi:hypothetical protein